MARSQYGLTPGEVVVQKTPTTTDDDSAIGIVVDPAKHLAIWSYDRSTQYSDLQTCDPANPTASGSAISTVPFSSTTGRSPFQGPDGVNTALWGFDGTNWWLFNPADLANRANATTVSWTNVKAAADYNPATIRGDIGAGTSSLALGATSTTAKAGDYQPTVDQLTNASASGKALIKAADYPTMLGLLGALSTADVAGKVDKSGSVTQLQDWADAAPSDGNVPQWDGGVNAYAPVDLTEQFAQVDANTGRLAQADEPENYHPIIVLDVAAPVPAGTRTDTIVFRRAAASSIIPVFISSNFAQGSSTVGLATTGGLNVGDWLGVSAGATGADGGTPVSIASVTATYSTGAGPVTFATFNNPNASAATVNGIAKVTTAVPSTATITLTAKDGTGTTITRVHFMGMLYKLPGLSGTAAIDQQVNAGGSSSGTMTTIATPATGVPTTVAREVCIGSAVFNSLTATVGSRTLADSYAGWTKIGTGVKSDNGSTARTLAVFYQVLSSIGNPKFQSLMTASDGATGQWAAQMITVAP